MWEMVHGLVEFIVWGVIGAALKCKMSERLRKEINRLVEEDPKSNAYDGRREIVHWLIKAFTKSKMSEGCWKRMHRMIECTSKFKMSDGLRKVFHRRIELVIKSLPLFGKIIK